MRIVLIHKAEFHKRPPVISVVENLMKLRHNLVLITCGISEEYERKIIGRGVEVHVFTKTRINNFFISKIVEYLMFRKFVFSIISRYSNEKSDLLLWIEGAYTIVALGVKIKQYPYILQIQELHEKSRLYLYVIGKVIHDAETVFMPEYNRTVLYQIWFKLKQRPIVLPNKPYFIPSNIELEQLKIKYRKVMGIFERRKVILYQGHISKERDLSNYIKAIQKINEDFQLVLVGYDHGILKQYFKIDPELIHIGFVPAPDYLLFTSMAYMGIVTYDTYELNSAYCAPNKIYEYAAFSLPMLGNDIPGLKNIFEQNKIGVIVNENDENSIITGILEISNQIESYRAYARKFYDTVDNTKTIRNVISGLNNESQ